MKAQPACQFPDTFNGVQIGTIWRKEVQFKSRLSCISPLFVHLGMMISGVVADGYNAFAFLAAFSLDQFHKIPEGLPVKSIGFS